MRIASVSTLLQWDEHNRNLCSTFMALYQDGALVDVTLACRDGNLEAHKILLTASSPFFADIFRTNPCQHPVIVLRHVAVQDMKLIIEFIYTGSTQVPPKVLTRLLQITSELEIRGMEKFAYMNNIDMIPVNGHHKDQQQHTVPGSGSGSGSGDDMMYGERNGDRKDGQKSICARDTRYKGLKRVTVNFEGDDPPRKIPNSRYSPDDDFTVGMKRSENNISGDLGEQQPLQHFDTTTLNFYTNDDDNVPISEIILNGQTEYQCSVCLKSYKYRKDTVRHADTHIGKSFNCDYCPKTFDRSSHMIRHRRIHTGERPYTCDLCGKLFARQDKLKIHLRTVHQENADLLDEESIMMFNEDCFETEDGENYMLKKQYRLKPISTKTSTPLSIAHTPLMPVKSDTMERDYAGSSKSFQNVFSSGMEKKRGRGRPRKYPVPEIKIELNDANKPRRGRPRKNVMNLSAPATQLSHHSSHHSASECPPQDNYDITTLPYGDLAMLTMPLEQELIEIGGGVTMSRASLAPPSPGPETDPLQLYPNGNVQQQQHSLPQPHRVEESRHVDTSCESSSPDTEEEWTEETCAPLSVAAFAGPTPDVGTSSSINTTTTATTITSTSTDSTSLPPANYDHKAALVVMPTVSSSGETVGVIGECTITMSQIQQ